MKWKKFTLTTTTEAVDLVSSMFDDIGIEGIEIEDNIPLTEKETKGMFIDILPELPPDEGIAKVSFYLDDDADVEEILKKVEEGLDELSLFTDLGARIITAGALLRHLRQRIRTGSTTGNNTLSPLPWTIS